MHERRGRRILRTSPFGHSAKLDFHFTEFYEVRLRNVLESAACKARLV
jgi:hypothetical protein